MRGVLIAVIAGGMALGVSGCAAGRNDFVRLNPATRFEARPANAPVTLTVGDLNRPYQEIGVIHVSGVSRESYEGLNERLREEARNAGADAVIFVRYGTENAFSIIPFFVAIPYDVLVAEGLAVRSK